MKRIFALFLSALCLVNGFFVSSSSVYAEEIITENAVYPEISLYNSYVPAGGDLYYLESLGTPDCPGAGVVDPSHSDSFYAVYQYPGGNYTFSYLKLGISYNTIEDLNDDSLYIRFDPILKLNKKTFKISHFSEIDYLYYVTVSGKVFKCVPVLGSDTSNGGLYVQNPYFLTHEQGTFYTDICKFRFDYNGTFASSLSNFQLGQCLASLSLTSVCYGLDSDYLKPTTVWTETTDFVVPTTEPTSSTAPTSDPALGQISDDVNNLDKNEQARHEETKGFLQNIIDTVVSLPKKIADLFIDGLKALFIPSDGYLTEKMDEVTKTLEEHLGFLAFPMKLLNDILQMVNSFGGSGSGKIDFPACQINLNGETHTLWDKQTFDFNDVLKNFPILNDHLYTATNFVCFACVLMFAANIIKKYLPIDGANMVDELIDDDK